MPHFSARHFSLLFSTLIFTAVATQAQALTDYEKKLTALVEKKAPEKQKLEAFYKLMWDHTMRSYPEYATSVGYPGFDDQWTDNSAAAILERQEEDRFTLGLLLKIKVSNKIQGEDRISYDLAVDQLQTAVEGQKFHDEWLPINQMGGVQIDLSEMFFAAPKNNVADFDHMLSRLEKIPKVLEQTQALLAEGVAHHVTQPRVILSKVPAQFDLMTPAKIEDSPIYGHFKEIPNDIPASEKARIQSRAQEILRDQVYPAFKKIRTYFNDQYLPACRTSTAWSDLPDGKDWYNYKIKMHTTTTMTADEVHALGLKEVERIEGEMNKIRESLKFKGDLPAFHQFLRESDQFTPKSAAELLTGYRDIAKRIDPELPKLFGRLPRLTYGVREMPAFAAPAAPTAYYQNGALETGRAGYFEANTYNLKARPTWAMEVLTLHEAVPGHHLQISLAQELEGLPEFRKNTGPTAFIEGWGLYSESLGEELGLYKDPYSKFGQLGFEVWRAVRLVVDTGLHAKGWSRDQVVTYFRAHTPITEEQIQAETDRYITYAGQALAYKIGELKFKELKRNARDTWGDKFNIRQFHDRLLGSGALPLSVLEKKMAAWQP